MYYYIQEHEQIFSGVTYFDSIGNITNVFDKSLTISLIFIHVVTFTTNDVCNASATSQLLQILDRNQ